MNMRGTHMIKINLPGGIVTSGELLDILTIVENVGINTVRFGNRQQLLFSVAASELEELKNDLLISDINYEVDREDHPNILSSYVTEDIIYNAHWLKEGVYKDILDLFDHEPRLKINLVDNSQTFVPFFTGNMNFISADISNYWYLYIRFPKTNILYCWPTLVYSDDIPGISKLIEEEIFGRPDLYYDQPEVDGDELHRYITSTTQFVLQPQVNALKLPDFHLPFYEGFNRYGNNKLWLGIYRRDENFPVAFLKDICKLCLRQRIGQIYSTPWRSIVIKGIDQADRGFFGDILNRYRINVRHAANELNWQIDELSEDGLAIKRQLVRELEEADTRTYRLCFAVKLRPKSGLFGSVFITRKRNKELFDISYTRDFNPNSKILTTYRTDLKREQLSACLIQLCDHFYAIQNSNISTEISTTGTTDIFALPQKQVHQCRHCLTIYNEEYGDDVNQIVPGTTFASIANYDCPTCGADKTEFVLICEPVVL